MNVGAEFMLSCKANDKMLIITAPPTFDIIHQQPGKETDPDIRALAHWEQCYFYIDALGSLQY